MRDTKKTGESHIEVDLHLHSKGNRKEIRVVQSHRLGDDRGQGHQSLGEKGQGHQLEEDKGQDLMINNPIELENQTQEKGKEQCMIEETELGQGHQTIGKS